MEDDQYCLLIVHVQATVLAGEDCHVQIPRLVVRKNDSGVEEEHHFERVYARPIEEVDF